MAMGGDEFDREIARLLFPPSDEALVVDYLWPWVTGRPMASDFVTVADISSTPPWKLLAGRERAYFITEQKRLGSSRTSRTMETGRWKKQSAGKVNSIDLNTQETLRWKKSLLSFHLIGEETTSGFVMHEYQLCDPDPPGVCSQPKRRKISHSGPSSPSPQPPAHWVLCLVRGKPKADIFSNEKPKAEFLINENPKAEFFFNENPKSENRRKRDRDPNQVVDGMSSAPLPSQEMFDGMTSTPIPSHEVQCSDLTDASSFHSDMFQVWDHMFDGMTPTTMPSQEVFDEMTATPMPSQEVQCSDLTDASSFHSDMFEVWDHMFDGMTPSTMPSQEMFDEKTATPMLSQEVQCSDLTDASSFYSDMFQVWEQDAIDEVLQMLEGDDPTYDASSWHLV